jgi:site-specific recombinase XerD
MTKSQKTKLEKIRKTVDKEKKRLRITEPKFTIQLDGKTDKLLLGYSIPIDVGIDIKGKRIIRKKQKKKYLSTATINDLKYVVMNVQKYADMVSNEINSNIRSIGGDKDTITYWAKFYYENPYRFGNIEISPKSLNGDKCSLTYLINFIEKEEPSMLNIWNWVEEGRDFLVRYMKHKQTIGGDKKKWSNGSVNSDYRRIRAFFNFVSHNIEGYPMGILNKMPFAKSKTITETFTPLEMVKVKQFMEDYADGEEWCWFIPILHTLLETGCRVSEVCSLRINNLEPIERKINIIGKGNKKRFLYLKSESLWNRIHKYIYDSNGKIRIDKEYIFHLNYYVRSYDNWYFMEDISKPFSTSGVQHKFKNMIKFLKLNPNLTTHCTRRYFITEMLKKTNGDIPLVAQLVGHNTWDVVKLYTKDLIDDSKKVNVGLFD